MLYDPTYSREGQDLVQQYRFETGNVMRYSARDVRKESSGTHARLAIAFNHVTLAWSVFNVERDEDRVRLANSAYRAWGKDYHLDQEEMSNERLKKGLDLFCEGLWDEMVSSLKGGLMYGDPDIGPPGLLLGHYILSEGGTILFAPPGRGKSYTAMLMAVSLDAGVETIWPVPSGPRRCMYINLERGTRSMSWRLAAVNRALGLDARRPLPFLNARGRTLKDVLESASETAREHNAEVVFLDSISRTGYGDMTADRVVNGIMDDMNAHFPTWVALGHTPRQDETHTFGSQMFDAAADLAVQLATQSNDQSTGIALEVVKANDVPKGKATRAVHVLEWGEFGLTGVRQARRNEFTELEAARRRGLRESVLEYLLHVGGASGTQIANELGLNRTNVADLLRLDQAFSVLRKEGQSVIYGVTSKEDGNTYP